jgi:hypothetical protein
MAQQTYATHRHNPMPTTVGALFVLIAIVAFALRYFEIGGREVFGVGLLSLCASNLVLLGISRRYTTRLQDRIIKLEMKLRCAEILTPGQQAALSRLSTPQVVALRFASNAELPALLDRAEREHLPADQIKRAITQWVPDLDRT